MIGIRMKIFLLVLMVLAAGCGGEFKVRPFEPAGKNAICYGPHRDGQRPGGPDPSAAELLEDLTIMASRWNMIRIYGSQGPTETLLEIIQSDGLDLKVMLGVWILPESPEANNLEVETGIRLANTYPDIVNAVSVGNETQVSWSPHVSPLEELIGYVRRVRAAVTVPVTVADDYNFWNKPESLALSPEIDFITMHAHPLWNGLLLDQAVTWLDAQVTTIQAMHPDRLVVLGETGWATAVHDEGEQARLIKGVAGEAEQKKFYLEVRAWAATQKMTVFFFEAFDENWKGGPHPNEVEKHWGLFRTDRTPKAALASE